jgi:hypothetical protein
VLAAARGGRQLPRPAQLNVARRTLALLLRGWHGGPRPQQHLLAHDGGAALGDCIAAPLGERREAFQAAGKNRNLVCAIIRLRTSLRAAFLGSHGQAGRGPRAHRRRARRRARRQSRPPGGTFGGYEMTPAPACRCTLWQRECAARAPYCLLVVEWRLSDCRSIPFGKYKSASGHFFVCPFRGWVSCLRRFCGTCRAC